MQERDYKVIGAYEGVTPDKLIYGKKKLCHPTRQQILVKVMAISVNPIDTKLRQTLVKQSDLKIFGYDAVGKIVAIGNQVKNLKIGDAVFYAGTTKKDGSNAEYQLVDARLVAKKPINLTTAQSAAMPLTSLTACELLFDKMGLTPQANAHVGATILIINGAGGVGAIMTQLAKWLGMIVITTAGKPDSRKFCLEMGADFVVSHYQNYGQEIKQLGFRQVDFAVILNALEQHFTKVAELIAPFGRIGSIVASQQDLPLTKLKNKSVSFDWEYMFAKTDYDYKIESQGKYLELIAKLLDMRLLKSTLTTEFDGINLVNLKKAHAMIESGHTIGKIVLSGSFE